MKNILTILAQANSIQDAVSSLVQSGYNPEYKASPLSDGWYELPELNFWVWRGQIYVNLKHDEPMPRLPQDALALLACLVDADHSTAVAALNPAQPVQAPFFSSSVFCPECNSFDIAYQDSTQSEHEFFCTCLFCDFSFYMSRIDCLQGAA
ncbi:MAG: hypothetical protein LAT55_12270 [Opitutales bacterium]|nr:hypothetical protein [Opitutales bacterium]